MDSQSVVKNLTTEVVIDIEPFVQNVKSEPSDNECEEESEPTDYYDDYEANAKSENESTTKNCEDSTNQLPVQHVKEELVDEESDEENSNNLASGKKSKSEFTIHAMPSTSKQSDNMIYFEIPAIETQCKCVVCGASFKGDSRQSDQYICTKCLKKKDFTKESSTKRNTRSCQVQSLPPDSPNPPVVKKRRKYIQAKPYECEECCRKCKSISDLTKHKLIHSGERPFECDLCPKRFNQLSNLIRHKSTHSDIKPFRCGVCSKTFTQASYLKKHNLTHSGEKPYGCVVCLKRFSDYSTLSKHKLIHSGEKPYMCGICLKTFNQLASLRRHEVIHRDEKPFECKICSKRFAQSHHLKRHQTIHRVMFVNMSLPKFKKERKPKSNSSSKINQDEDRELTFDDLNYDMGFQDNYETYEEDGIHEEITGINQDRGVNNQNIDSHKESNSVNREKQCDVTSFEGELNYEESQELINSLNVNCEAFQGLS